MANAVPETPRRETRLLALVLIVSVALLILLARFQFPASTMAVATPAASPLAGLAARAAFDDMAATSRTLLAGVSDVVVGIDMRESSLRATGTNGRSTPEGRAMESRATVERVTGLRVRPDVVLVAVPPGLMPSPGAPGTADAGSVADDPQRGLALLRVGAGARTLADLPTSGFTGFGYVGVVTAAEGGPTIQPVFIGRTDLVSDSAWSAPLLAVGRPAGVPPGALVFSLNGGLVGLAIVRDGAIALVPPDALETLASQAALAATPSAAER